ncbi:MAG: V-type ATPase 116kDa subunit family protein, partial [Bacteroidales bacterium]
GARLIEIAGSGIPALEKYRNVLIDNIEYSKAVHHTLNEAENHLRIVEVWSPDHLKEKLEQMLEHSEAVYVKSRPAPGETVPVLLRNKRFSKDFELIGDIYSLPKYGELDLTPFFAPFYALFFGFCLGDVGYGLMMLLGAILFKSKVPKKFKPIMNLVAYLGTATILFGLIGGTFFGINLYGTNLPLYRSLQDHFESNNTNINNYLFYLSLIIGGVQIIFGMILKAINEITQFGWKVAVGTMGWILLLVGMISLFLVGKITGVNQTVISVAQKALLVVSGSMILLFNNLNRKIYINLGAGIWNTYNMITGILGDLLSYIRLFALGIASAILGFVFNSLAVSMSGDIPVVSVLIMIIILVIGHSINIFMSGLGAFVHPMRLTFVEFYKNAGFTGGGRKYQPFRKMSN